MVSYAAQSSCHVYRGFNVFWLISCIVNDLLIPYLLHILQFGMLDHLHMWRFYFLKMHELLNKYNPIWLSVAAYHNLTPTNRSDEQVSQSDGKEMNHMSWLLLAVVTQTLWSGSPAQHPIFNHAIECTWALLELYLCAWYISYDDATLGYTEDAERRFHSFKDVFLLGRVSNQGQAKANTLRTEFMKKRNLDEDTNAETWMSSMKRREMNTSRDNISHNIDGYRLPLSEDPLNVWLGPTDSLIQSLGTISSQETWTST